MYDQNASISCTKIKITKIHICLITKLSDYYDNFCRFWHENGNGSISRNGIGRTLDKAQVTQPHHAPNHSIPYFHILGRKLEETKSELELKKSEEPSKLGKFF